MKFEITQKGVYDGNEKRIPVGTIVEIKGDEVPRNLVNKGRVVGSNAKRVAVTNPASNPVQTPASGSERQALLAETAAILEDDEFLKDGKPDVAAVNAQLEEDEEPFTAKERDDLWPGVADQVKATRDAS